MWNLLLICAIAVLAKFSSALPQRHRNHIHFDGSIVDIVSGNYSVSSPAYAASVNVVKESTLDQLVDHFNHHEVRTFKQRYFVDETYWNKAADAPVFLCVGGEGPPLDRSVLTSSVHCNDMVELAPKHGALLLALEHRYYGTSMPSPGDYSTENLQYLSSEQALEDLASFHAYVSDKYALSTANKWVTWGGSYPGMMAAMARLRFPHLIHASVSSSSPLQAALDFPGYNNVVAESISNPAVGGSAECLAVVVDGHKQIGELLKTPAGRRELESTFNLCGSGALENEKNQEQFAGDGVIYIPVQSNDPSCTTSNCNIEKICKTLTSAPSTTSAMQRLADYAKSPTCSSVSYDDMIKAMANPKSPVRSWLYQTCNEWGFYQTCEVGTACPYTQGLHTPVVDLDICLQAFSFTEEQVKRSISAANTRYGGAVNFQATRILFPNGEVDPWKAGGVLTSPPNSQEEPVLLVKGASHHFWTHPSLPTDSAEVNAARQVIWKQVDEWLA